MQNHQAPAATAEVVEGRELAKGNAGQQNRVRTQCRAALSRALDRVRQAAQDSGKRWTALWHQVYTTDRRREAYYRLTHDAAPGGDGQTWAADGEQLDTNLRELSDRLQRGAYQAPPVERVDIPKADGRQRPIGKPTLEDKIVQRATVEVLNAVYEPEFLGFSSGARPGRSPHHAVAAVTVGSEKRHINWVPDADSRGFYEAMDHAWLVKVVEHRIGDQRVVRHMRKWLKAGVLEDGQWRPQAEGTPHGGSASPLLANLYLHYVFDLWAAQWRRRYTRGDVIIVRYCDDFLVGFQHKDNAKQFLSDLRERFHRFHLERHPDKTRLIEFGRWASERRQRRGQGKPETFDFLGLTHRCRKTRTGKFTVRRTTVAKRLRTKVQESKQTLRERMHWPIRQLGAWLKRVLTGHYRSYGVPRNMGLLRVFQERLLRYWCHTLRRRSQRHRISWQRIYALATAWLPPPHLLHPYPAQRLHVTTRGRSPVRECRTPGSVRGGRVTGIPTATGDLNESSDDRPRRHADACWPRMGALQSIDASPDYKRKCLRRGAVFGTLKVLAGSTAIVRAKIA
jgi:RNA-directed DNA polymerase